MKYETPVFTPERHTAEDRMKMLEAKVAFLLDEVSILKSIMRHLASDGINKMPIFERTKESFNYQWEYLPNGDQMLSNEEWKKDVPRYICERTGLPADWFKDKRVMDAGCGSGRWSYGLGKLNVGSCVSFDISDSGIKRAKEVTKEFGDRFIVEKRDILADLNFGPEFDLVWCFGVLHHTGNTYKGFQNLAKCVKPEGYLFLMLYGEPRPNNMWDYVYYHEIFGMRCSVRNSPFAEKAEKIKQKYGEKEFHGYFDAISPEINDLYRWDEIVRWLTLAGFEDIKWTLPEHPNHHVVARKRLG